MKNHKNIDRLFQERFKDFETEPNEQTWSKIQAALQAEKKERPIVPIWYKYAGIAAAFFLGFFALNTVFKTNEDPKNTIVLEKKIVTIPSYTTDSIAVKTTQDFKNIDHKKQPQITETNDNKSKSTRENSEQLHTKTPQINSRKTQYQNSVAVYQKEHHRTLKEPKLVTKSTKKLVLQEKNNFKNTFITEPSLDKNTSGTVASDKIDFKLDQTPNKKETTNPAIPNELEELLKEKEGKKEQVVVGIPKNKWEIVPNVAAMYLKNNSSGSAIDPQLSKNNKTADNGFSYGLGINYALTNKIALRSGINTFSVGYNTNDVSFAAGLNTNSLANVNYTSTAVIEIQNQATYNSLNSFEKGLQKTSTGSINQKMGYYEVPLELSYAVLDKKFGINIIGGISTLFLKQNEIALVSSESNFKIGEASNLNSVHFSTNFGFGFKYQIVKSFQLKFEPMLKYQLNTYATDSGNFKPIYIGLYSGVSYRF